MRAQHNIRGARSEEGMYKLHELWLRGCTFHISSFCTVSGLIKQSYEQMSRADDRGTGLVRPA